MKRITRQLLSLIMVLAIVFSSLPFTDIIGHANEEEISIINNVLTEEQEQEGIQEEIPETSSEEGEPLEIVSEEIEEYTEENPISNEESDNTLNDEELEESILEKAATTEDAIDLSEENNQTGYVTISIDKFTVDGTYILEPKIVEFVEGETVWDVTKRVLEDNDISYEIGDYSTIYIESIDGLREFDITFLSGWKYCVNDVYPSRGCSEYELKDGDVINWRFTLELGNDLKKADKTQLQAALDEAIENKSSVVVSVDGSDVEPTLSWLTEEIIAAYEDRIEKAQEIFEEPLAIQSMVDEALEKLNLATETFNSAKQIGTKVENAYSYEEILNKSLAYIHETVTNPTFSTISGEWSIIALARGEYPVADGYYDIYYNNVVEKVKELMPKYSGKLHRAKSTEHSRLILALTAIGKDITDVAGYDIREGLADFNFVIKQGINGPIFALIALNSHDYEIPVDSNVDTQTTREMLIDYILEREIAGGGWTLGGTKADPDITAMAIQALTPYYETHEEVKKAVNRGINWLSSVQTSDGGFESWGSDNLESCAQVIVALTGLGIDPHTDERFIKNGNSIIDALLSFAVYEGGFYHVKPGETGNGGAEAGVVDGMATEQGTYALVAYDRFVKGKNSLYHMTDVSLHEPETPEEPERPEIEKIQVPEDEEEYKIEITESDKEKKIDVTIPESKTGKVIAELPVNEELPEIKAKKGQVFLLIPKGTKLESGNTAVELITLKNREDNIIKEKLNNIVDEEKKVDNVLQVFSMGGDEKALFNDYVTLTLKNMAGKEVAYIQNGEIFPIQKYKSDSAGLNSGKEEYVFDNGNDLIVKTKHFTDFVIYTTSNVEDDEENTGGNNSSPETPSKGYITLSIDKLTIDKGYVLRPIKVEFTKGESVWDVTKRELDKRGIDYDYNMSGKYGSVYVERIAGDGEFDHGSGSGWMYNVNGWYPNYGASKYELEDGDIVQWRYTTNLGKDLGEDISQWEDLKDNEKTKEDENDTKETGKTDTSSLNTDTSEAVEKDKEDKIVENKPIDIEKFYLDSSSISSWAYDSVKRATEKGFIEGHNDKFRPKDNITRAEFTKIIVSLLGLDTSIGKALDFSDVKENDWFYPYINAAYKAGIVEGSNSKFKPKNNITRQEMAAIIIRALGVQYIKSQTSLKDMDKVSNWAKKDVETAIALGIMVGTGDNFNPKSSATREMAATVAMRVYDYIEENKLEDKANTDSKSVDVSSYIEDTAEFLQETVTNPTVSTIGGEWTILGLARSGVNVPDEYYERYYSNVEKTLKEKSGILHRIKYTEYDRVILALTSIGKDITNVAGYDLRKPLADFNTLTKQGINGPIFALIALNSHDYEIPVDSNVDTQTTREMLIDFILNREIEGGGWALGENPDKADPDITAMAIHALTPYYKTHEEVKKAVDRGINWLSSVQTLDGGYASWGSDNLESCAQVIVALTGLGIDPHNDERFIKNGHSVVDALLNFAVEGGGFYHIKPGETGNGGAKPGEVDLMATDQAMYALVAYKRFVDGENPLYDMTDVK